MMFAASPAPEAQNATAKSVPKIGHIFVIMLENEGYAATFGPP